jgi:putative FmdB family regulatory protein
MPIYEYHCGKCNSEFELLIRTSEQPVCPSCGAEQLEKLLSVPAAPSVGSGELPLCPPAVGQCGRPACGEGGCQGF